MAIDDLADRFHAVDLVLNQNPGPCAFRDRGLVPSAAHILDGRTEPPVLVRPEFAALRLRADRARQHGETRHRGRVDRVLVFLSGSDPHDVTGRAARAATALGVAVDVVVGAAYPFLALVAGLVFQTSRWSNSTSIPPRWRPSWSMPTSPSAHPARPPGQRLRTLGLPTVLVTLADNQVETARHLADVGAALYLGWQSAVTTAELEDALTALGS